MGNINLPGADSEVFAQAIADRFVDVNKTIELGSGSLREVDDIMLSDTQFRNFWG